MDYTLKIVVGGDGGVGKTTHMHVFLGDPYCNHELTVGIDFHIKKVRINGSLRVLQMWDLGGQDQFRFMLPSFLKEAHGFLLGFDVFRHKTFINLGKWVNIFREACPQVPIILVGYKIDKGYHPVVNRKRALEFIEKFNIAGYAEVSSKTNKNIEFPFIMLLENLNIEQNTLMKIDFLSKNEI